MNKVLLKVLSGTLALVMTASVLSGCATKAVDTAPASTTTGTTAGTAAATSVGTAQTTTADAALPISTSGLQLTMWSDIVNRPQGKNMNLAEVECFKEYEKRTGVKIVFTHPAAGQESESFNLMMASNDLPDMIMTNWTTRGSALKYASTGQIVALNDGIDKYSTNLNKYLTENPDIKKQLAEVDGKIYLFPFVRGSDGLRVVSGMQIRKDWLDKLNLKVPTTIDEFYNVLKAFKEKDPNENGKADEVPIIQYNIYSIVHFFYMYGIPLWFYQDNGTVKYGLTQPEFKDAVTFLNKLYNEGLLDPDYAITDTKQFDYKVTNGLGGVWWGMVGGTMGRLNTLMAPIDPKFDLVAIPWLKGQDGKAYCIDPTNITAVNGVGIAITSANKNITESVKWADYAYSEEGSLLLSFGIEGKTYNMENGYPKYTDEITKNPQGLSFSDALTPYALPFGWAFIQDERYFEQYTDKKRHTAISVWKQGDTSRTMPPIKFTTEETQAMTTKLNDINTYTYEMMHKFIMGKEPISNFDQYIEATKKMGIDEVTSIQQKAFDRYNTN